jgi:uncharacterized protein YqjF (DUF2071 family)
MMAPAARPFLTAEWRDLVMLNYEIDPAALVPLVPAGTELDAWQGRTLVSLVGFLFIHARVLGVPIPRHRNFEEVNLRFYVRRRSEGTWRRAVVFVKEIVPRRAIAFLARILYGENYVALPMSHVVADDPATGSRRVSYAWTAEGREHRMDLTAAGRPHPIQDGSEEEFITEHYWGYSRARNGGTLEYQVTHPRWRVWRAREAHFDGDGGALYGPRFAESLGRPPVSALLAEGSPVTVYQGVPLIAS